MTKEYIVIALEWIVCIALLIKFIPRNKIREAQVAFMFKHVITWLTGLAVVEAGLIEYPVRLFPHASRTNFTFEYFTYPAFCAVFNLHYPENKSGFSQFMYYFYYCTGLTIAEVMLERYTNILKYIHWTWYITWISFFVTFYLTRKYCLWFFRKE